MMEFLTNLISDTNSVPALDVLVFCVGLSGATSFGIVQLVKMIVDGILKMKNKNLNFPFRNPAFRILSIWVGAGVGFLLLSPAQQGILIGGAAGFANAMIFMGVRKFVKGFIDSKTGGEPEEPTE